MDPPRAGTEARVAGPAVWRAHHRAATEGRRYRCSTVALLGFLIHACALAAAAPARVERQLALMGTSLTIEIEAVDRAAALAASEAALRALEAAEARLSTWTGASELARLNAAPAGRPVSISPALRRDLEGARACFELTGGAFDPGVGALVDLWDQRGAGRLPSAAERARALIGGGLSALRLDAGSATRAHVGLRLEEGGFGKGAGLDDALAALAARPAVASAALDLGGQLAFHGAGREFRAPLADPGQRDRAVLEIGVAAGSLSTSGNSERAIEVDGRRYGHLLDPRRGEPVPDFGSVTVWAPSALLADCLSTGLYVLGPDAALAWAAAHPEYEVLVLARRPGGGVRARASAGLRGRIRALEGDLRLEFEPSMEPRRRVE